MPYSNYKRFLVARYNEAHRLLCDPDTRVSGTDILRDLLNSWPSPGPWLRMKCHLALSVYNKDLVDAQVRPATTRSEACGLTDMTRLT